MRERPLNPRHLDVEALAERGAELNGKLPLRGLPRLLESAHPEVLPGEDDQVSWQVRGERRGERGSAPQTWLHLQAECDIALTCQRCLQAVRAPLKLSHSYRFVAGEAAAAEADIDAEEDVLASTHALDLPGLIEDELLLALPLVPRHDSCPQPLAIAPGGADELPPADARANPFGVLAGFKPRKAGP